MPSEVRESASQSATSSEMKKPWRPPSLSIAVITPSTTTRVEDAMLKALIPSVARIGDPGDESVADHAIDGSDHGRWLDRDQPRQVGLAHAIPRP